MELLGVLSLMGRKQREEFTEGTTADRKPMFQSLSSQDAEAESAEPLRVPREDAALRPCR